MVAGAVLLDELFSALNIAHMRVSPFALREGVLQARPSPPPQPICSAALLEKVHADRCWDASALLCDLSAGSV